MAARTIRRRSAYRAINRHGQKKSRSFLRLAVVLLVGFTMLTSGASAGTLFFYGDSLPTLGNFKSRFQFQNTLIRDGTGRVLYDMADVSRGRGRRVVVPLIDPRHRSAYYREHKEDWLVGPRGHGVPVVFQEATIATEDSSFYTNPGFDPLSIARAAYDNLAKGHIVSGASTITQQLVRDYMLDPNQVTLTRKGEEIWLAAELTQKYDKSKILWYYLNSVPYGNLSYGAEAAAKQYFGKDVWQLGLPESAFLAGLPEAPSTYNPVNNLPGALNRMRYVLHLMYIHGYLKDGHGRPDPSMITWAMSQTRTWKFQPAVTLKIYPHFVQYAVDQLQTIPQVSQLIHNGLDVWTTLDPRLQEAAQHTVSKQISQVGPLHVTDGALVSMNLRRGCPGCVYGGILAMVGSADYTNKAIAGQINMADRPRQPGSSFKPFNYVLAFEHGLAPGTSVYDGPIALPDPGNPDDGGWYEPLDYDRTWHGGVTLRLALANSLNVPAIKVEQYNASLSPDGTQAIAKQAVKMGMSNLLKDNPNCCGWALTLGGLERGVRLVQETSAYGTFATGGQTVPPMAIWKVYDRTTHKLLFDATDPKYYPQHGTQVVDPAYAYLITNILSDNNSRCAPVVCEFGLDSPLNLDRPVAAKTGTTEGFTDNWTVGYTPDIVSGVWVGNADNSPMVNSTGITGAAPIWHDYMKTAFDVLKLPPKDFVEPPGVYFGTACRLPGELYAQSSMGGDIFAGGIPLCSVGTYNTNVPIPQDVTNDQAAQPSQPQVQPPAAPTAPLQQVPSNQPSVPSAPAPVQQQPAPVQQQAQPPVQQQAQTPAQQPPVQQPAQPPAQTPPNNSGSNQIPGIQPSPP